MYVMICLLSIPITLSVFSSPAEILPPNNIFSHFWRRDWGFKIMSIKLMASFLIILQWDARPPFSRRWLKSKCHRSSKTESIHREYIHIAAEICQGALSVLSGSSMNSPILRRRRGKTEKTSTTQGAQIYVFIQGLSFMLILVIFDADLGPADNSIFFFLW